MQITLTRVIRTLSAATVLAIASLSATPNVAIAQDEKAAVEAPAPQAVIDRFIKVTGGKVAYKKHSNRTIKGTFGMPSANLTGSLLMMQKAPNLMTLNISIPGIGDIKQGYNGTVGWSLDPMRGPSILEGEQLAQLQREADFFGSADMLKFFDTAETEGPVEFAGEEAWQLNLATEESSISVFFSVKSGLNIGTKAKVASPLGQIESLTIQGDYKEFGGIMLATMTTVSVMGQTQEIRMTDVTFEDIDASAFDLPPVIATLATAAKKAEEASAETEKAKPEA